ncbi:MAG: ABC transporter permease [Planctomycetes bacterium]|nr:ABC transporter permease [Planctomycetota bacterium]MBZ0150309.1 ABC transporter permease [Planctomycetota bacterium]MCC7065068.1 ABC transporter permease [Planctomycetota bacterium]
MNLAVRDIRHSLGRFVLTTVGVGMLLMTVMGMGGIYRGLVDDALVVTRSVGADLWIVQRDTRGPFAEVSRLPRNLTDRVAAVPGVVDPREFVFHTIQREHRGMPFRMAVLGLGWPADKGEGLPLVAGRVLAQNHYEMIADESLGLALGERLRLGKDTYTVVGLTRAMVSSGGDGIACFTSRDAQAIQFDEAGESARLERQARRARAGEIDFGRTQPSVLERAAGSSRAIAALPAPAVSAVIARLMPGADLDGVLRTFDGWSDVTVHTAAQQEELLLKGTVDRARRQILLFRVLLTIISAVIMALIIYTLTLDKLHPIALLKLIGAPNHVIVGLIMQQSLIMGALAYGVGYLAGERLFPMFPRRVLVTNDDLLRLGGIVLVISVLASLLGIWKAMRVAPNEAIG